MLVEEAKDLIFNGLENGVQCPCCGRLAKMYKRKLNREMAQWLIWLVQNSDPEKNEGWLDIRKFDVRGGDYGKLVHWQLVQQCPNHDKRKRTSGLWRPTPQGVAFVKGQIQVPSHLHVYNNDVVGWSENMVKIEEALGETFNYAEI